MTSPGWSQFDAFSADPPEFDEEEEMDEPMTDFPPFTVMDPSLQQSSAASLGAAVATLKAAANSSSSLHHSLGMDDIPMTPLMKAQDSRIFARGALDPLGNLNQALRTWVESNLLLYSTEGTGKDGSFTFSLSEQADLLDVFDTRSLPPTGIAASRTSSEPQLRGSTNKNKTETETKTEEMCRRSQGGNSSFLLSEVESLRNQIEMMESNQQLLTTLNQELHAKVAYLEEEREKSGRRRRKEGESEHQYPIEWQAVLPRVKTLSQEDLTLHDAQQIQGVLSQALACIQQKMEEIQIQNR
jgi:hypothetical protein